MTYNEAKNRCHVRSAIYRTSNCIRYWRNNEIPLDDRVPDKDKLEVDWEEYDPREDDGCSLFAFND